MLKNHTETITLLFSDSIHPIQNQSMKGENTMSTVGKRDFRPRLHFSASQMWINDPNGMVYENGRYHLCYQYHPGSTAWGPMHWGHAVSRDLIHWEHLPIALYPDKMGTIFSGSAVYDTENTSGFGILGNPPIVAIYTQDWEGPNEKKDRKQQQSIAYSIDGINFLKYELNPVLPCPEGQTDFRDPKVFRNHIKNCWSMVLAVRDHVEFFASKDLIHWEKTGSFGPKGNLAPGVWECPDLFELESLYGTKAILIVSMGMDAESGGSRTQYFIGSFDGNTFLPDQIESAPLWLDEGFENYAGVTFDHTDSKILIGWANNWRYAADCPTNEFCSNMTLARELSLKQTKCGLRLAAKPLGLAGCITGLRNLRAVDRISSEVFALSFEGETDTEIQLKNASNQILRFGVHGENFFFDRSQAGDSSFSEIFASDSYSKKEVPRLLSGKWKVEAIFDVSHIELFWDNGTITMSCLVFPDTPYDSISFTGKIKARYMDLEG